MDPNLNQLLFEHNYFRHFYLHSKDPLCFTIDISHIMQKLLHKFTAKKMKHTFRHSLHVSGWFHNILIQNFDRPICQHTFFHLLPLRCEAQIEISCLIFNRNTEYVILNLLCYLTFRIYIEDIYLLDPETLHLDALNTASALRKSNLDGQQWELFARVLWISGVSSYSQARPMVRTRRHMVPVVTRSIPAPRIFDSNWAPNQSSFLLYMYPLPSRRRRRSTLGVNINFFNSNLYFYILIREGIRFM